MRAQINDIMERYENKEITVEEANAELAKIGAGFHLEPGRDGGWTEEEMAMGFFEPEDRGFERKPIYPRTPDMRKRPDLAGKTVRQKTVAGEFDVAYNESGYAVSAERWVPPQEEEA